ncbi:MAG: 2'-5' RNA ligase family protein [Anaerolineae bacterium]
MPFAITALFDESTEAEMHALRRRLVQAGHGDEASAEVRPHLTLAILPGLGRAASGTQVLPDSLRAWCAARPPLALGIAAVGTFPTVEGVVYLAPVVTAALLDMNRDLQAMLDSLGLTGYEAYRSDHWVPHVTIGIGLSPEAVAGAVRLAREADVFHTAILTQVALVEFPPMRVVCNYPLGG